MKQILQNLGSGETLLAEVPAPMVRAGHLLVRTEASLVSLGTERMLVSFGQANLLEKARQQPEKVKQVLEKIRTDGLFATLEAVRSKLDQPLALGYCNCGTVIEVGEGVSGDRGLVIGDRVVSNGPHAEVVCAPKNLCAKVPDGVSPQDAAFAVVGSIGLQGVRLAQPTVGENVVVLGLGLIGLLTVQVLRANGCRVLGTDFDPAKCALARSFGAETVDLSAGSDPVAAAGVFSRGRGVDAVLITASTKSSEPVSQAARMCRKRGRIVLVGVTGLELNRAEFYEKELSFQVSCSYGPGRYDSAYEQGGHDYPVGFVRWTEQRNFEAVLDLMASGSVKAESLISHRFAFDDALKAYELVGKGEGLGIVLSYGQPVGGGRWTVDGGRWAVGGGRGTVGGAERRGSQIGVHGSSKDSAQETGTQNQEPGTNNREPTIPTTSHRIALSPNRPTVEPSLRAVGPTKPEAERSTERRPSVGVIGAGNFAGQVLLPALAKTGAHLHTIVSAAGVTAAHWGRKFGFEQAGTDAAAVFADPEIDTVVIATRHSSHAKYVLAGLQAGKRVYVEKPLCLSIEELDAIGAVDGGRGTVDGGRWTVGGGTVGTVDGGTPLDRQPKTDNRQPHSTPFVMVGFNRRFSPHAVKMRALLAARIEPKTLVYTVNAGRIPPEHWTQAASEGGRIVGEACHFVDLLRFLVGAPIVRTQARGVRAASGHPCDNATLTLEFEDGSIGTVHYFANGPKSLSKERLEIFCGGGVLQLDNFRRLSGIGWPGFSKLNLWRQDKGHAAEMERLVEALNTNSPAPIPRGEIEEVTRATFALAEQLRS